MGMFGSRGASAVKAANVDPSQLSKSDKMILFGSMMRDVGSGLAGKDSDALMQAQALMAARQQEAKKQAFGQMLQGLLQPQYRDGPAANVTPTGGYTPGVMGQAPSATPGGPLGSAGGYQPPTRTADPLNGADPRLASLVMQGQDAGYDTSKLLDVFKLQQPAMAVGPGGEGYNTHDAGVASRRFRNPTNVNGWVTDLNNPDNENQYRPQLPNGVIPDGKGGVANTTGLTTALGQQEEATTTGRSMGTVFPAQNGDGSTSLQLGRNFLPSPTALRPAGAGGGPMPPRGAPMPNAGGAGNRSLTPGQETAQRTDYTAGAQTVAGAGDAAIKSQATAQQYQQAFNDVLSLDPNNLTGFKLGTAKILRSLGVSSPNLEQFTNTAEGYRMLTTQMVLPLAKELGSNPSNRDARIIQDSMPGLRTPRQTAAVTFAMAAATHNKEAARQQFFGNWTGDQSKAAMTRAWSAAPDSKRSIFQDPVFQRLQLDGHPAVVFKEKDGKRYGIFHPFNSDGSVNKNAQVFEAQ